jgi:hypothetical protein
LKNNSFSDDELQGTDVERIPTRRDLLAARSKVFETMLCGNFAEASKSVVPVGYDGPILRAIVEDCYTYHVTRLHDPHEIVKLANVWNATRSLGK